MTRNQKVNKLKVVFTVMCLAVFVVLIVNANKLSSTTEAMGYINPAFIGNSNSDTTINMDTCDTCSIDINKDDTAVVYYIVREGDTFESIANTFGTTVSGLKKINSITSIKPGQKIVVTDEEDGIIYTVRETQNIKVFANKYGLNLQDLMTLNYITDDTEILQKGQEIFLNLTEEKANIIPGFIDKGQPDLSPQVVKPKTPTKTTTTTSTSSKTTSSSSSSSSSTSSSSGAGKVQTRRTYTKNVNNGFARGYCTWYVATQMTNIFPYTSETTQSRPFGGNANQWYNNAKKAGFSVGQTPRAGSIVVYSNLRSSAGHVGIVRSVDTANGTMVVEDMNYEGKFVVTRRTESTSRGGIIGYIYG